MTMITTDTLNGLLIDALTAQGFSHQQATALTHQTILSEELGQQSVGIAHVSDYIDGLDKGRIDGKAVPSVSRPAPTMIHVDGKCGLPQTGFDLVFDDLVTGARDLGICAFLQKNTTTCGSLGTFVLRLAEAGLVAMAATNGPPLLAGSGATKPVFCTNPLAFSAPQAGGPPLLIDQSSSATAFVNIREAARSGKPIPSGWALNRHGQATTDPKAAFEGALLAFGGARGANIALMVEMLAAGLTGANWSLDAPSIFEGDQCPATGLFVLAINPIIIDPDFNNRMAEQIRRLTEDYDMHIPGLSKADAREQIKSTGFLVDEEIIAQLRQMADK